MISSPWPASVLLSFFSTISTPSTTVFASVVAGSTWANRPRSSSASIIPLTHVRLPAPVRLLPLPRRALAEVVVLGGQAEILVALLVELALHVGGLGVGERCGVVEDGAVVGAGRIGAGLVGVWHVR